LESVLAVRDQSILPGCHHTELDIVHIVEFAVRREFRLEPRLLGPLDVNDGDAFATGSHIRIGARDRHIACVCKRDLSSGNQPRLIEMSDVKHLESIRVCNKRIAELDGDTCWIAQFRCADLRYYFW